MKKLITRREFLKLSGAAFGSALFGSAFQSGSGGPLQFTNDFPRQPGIDMGTLARVAVKQVDVRSLPNDQAPIVGNRFRDQIIQIYEELRPPDAPIFYNTLWYRVWGGYIHSARLQKVTVRLNDPVAWVSPAGQLAEVTVPYTTAYQFTKWDGWRPWRGSRLYYSSIHWITAVEAGPDSQPWYKVVNELSESENYLVPASHMRPIDPVEYSPLSPEVPPDKKRIEVSLTEQMLRAFEGERLVLEARISSGVPRSNQPKNEYPTATPTGRFVIYSKMPSKHMGGVAGGDEVEKNGGFTLPGVPWTCFFRSPGGYALHGTYWHDNFGLQMSHGCINMRNDDAKFIFRWSNPLYDPLEIQSPADWEVTGHGTQVHVS